MNSLGSVTLPRRHSHFQETTNCSVRDVRTDGQPEDTGHPPRWSLLPVPGITSYDSGIATVTTSWTELSQYNAPSRKTG